MDAEDMLLFSMMLFIREFTVSAFQRVRSHEQSIESVASILRREEREREREKAMDTNASRSIGPVTYQPQ